MAPTNGSTLATESWDIVDFVIVIQDAKPLPRRLKFLIKQDAEETKIRYQVPNSIPIGSRSND
ncbi:hypothetical protein CUMW_184220 [Citrus unshiu]|uniref:Uncharacterized protein n=1 Tax=Citrus unshiu TaxID=55188 RepID=A0A2H5Q0F5_CITUN|nr:hypothetical protein CUMW_184220 [Citrus unshiu]